MRPGGAQLTVDKPPIEYVAGPPGECRDPVEARLRVQHSEIKGLFDARRRYVPFNPKHPRADLVVESSLAAAEKPALTVRIDEADMAAEIETGPVINGGVRRSIIRSLRIGGLSRNRRCGQHRSNAADCQKSVHAIPPDLQTCLRAHKQQTIWATQCRLRVLPPPGCRIRSGVAHVQLLAVTS